MMGDSNYCIYISGMLAHAGMMEKMYLWCDVQKRVWNSVPFPKQENMLSK